MTAKAGPETLAIAETLRRPLAELPDPLPVQPLRRPFDASVRPPGSKSIANRALLLASLAEGESFIENVPLDADDVRVMIEALGELGAPVIIDESARTATVDGAAGRFRGGVSLRLGNAGTAVRFLTAAACLADGPVDIDGDPRMRERPLGELVAMLEQLGVRVEWLGRAGFPPLRVHPARPLGGTVVVGPTQSSQFVSALMLLGPWTREGVELRFEGPTTSASYIELTQRVMNGAEGDDVCEGSVAERWIRVGPPGLESFNFEVEADAGGATFFWAAAALNPGATVRTEGVPAQGSAQPDAAAAQVIARTGASVRDIRGACAVTGGASVRAFEADLAGMPDAAPALAVLAAFADGPSTLTGLRTLRVKETDRITAIQTELAKIGVRVEAFQRDIGGGVIDEGVVIRPPESGVDCSDEAPRVEFDAYADHRMAMSLALVGLRRPNVFVRDPGCVRKSYATYWADLARLYMNAR